MGTDTVGQPAGPIGQSTRPDPHGAASLPLVLRLVRATAIIPVVLMGLGAVVSYGIGLVDLVTTAGSLANGHPDMPSMVVELVRVIDVTLVGMLMSILSFGIYELFVASIEWPLAPALVVRDIRDLERRVAQTIAVILAVTALDLVVEPTPLPSVLAVVGAVALALVAIAVYLRMESGHQR
jgi:uncharacterized membrane protein YqhA